MPTTDEDNQRMADRFGFDVEAMPTTPTGINLLDHWEEEGGPDPEMVRAIVKIEAEAAQGAAPLRKPDAQEAVVTALQLIVQWDAARKSRVLPQSLRNRAVHALGVWGGLSGKGSAMSDRNEPRTDAGRRLLRSRAPSLDDTSPEAGDRWADYNDLQAAIVAIEAEAGAAPRAEGLDVERLAVSIRLESVRNGQPLSLEASRLYAHALEGEYARLSRPSDERVPESEEPR